MCLISSYHEGVIDRFHTLDPIGWSTPRRRATYCRRLSSRYILHLYFRLQTFSAPTRARGTDTHSRRLLVLLIAEDRLFGATSYHKKKLNSTLPEMMGIYELTPNRKNNVAQYVRFARSKRRQRSFT